MTESKFVELLEIVRRLRKECPWDKEQTFDSLKAQTLEETYEVIEAIDDKNFQELKTELGDLLLHVIFHSVMAEEDAHFNIDHVIDTVTDKLVRRHPHVFGDTKVSGQEEVLQNWEAIKLKEGRKSVLDGVPKTLPGLQRASRLQERASKVGFDWEKKEHVWEKVIEEIKEMQEMENAGDMAGLEKEMGDVFFALINYCRFVDINPEDALRKTNDKFINRFQYVENKVKESGKTMQESSLEEMDKFWEESKELEQ